MCLAIPSRIVEIKGDDAVIDVDGVRREASLQLVEGPKVGDYVIVHAGYAITIMDEASANESLQAIKELVTGSPS